MRGEHDAARVCAGDVRFRDRGYRVLVTTLFLDTNHLIDLSMVDDTTRWRDRPEVHDGYLRLRAAIREGKVEPVVCRTTVFEWSDNCTRNWTAEITRVLDEAKRCWFTVPMQHCHTFEALDECRRHLTSLRWNGAPVRYMMREPSFAGSTLRGLRPDIPWPQDDDDGPEWYWCGAAQMGATSHDSLPYGEKVDLNAHLPNAIADWRRCLDERWVAQDLARGYVAGTLRLHDVVLPSRGMREGMIDLLLTCDWQQCPGLWAWVTTFEQYVRRHVPGSEPKPGDGMDLAHIHSVAYADYALLERGMRHLVTAGDQRRCSTAFSSVNQVLSAINV